jgi:hypothetical protein
MQLLCVALAGRPCSCRPNRRRTLKGSSYPSPHGRHKLTKQQDGTRGLLSSTSLSTISHACVGPEMVNGARNPRFTFPFTDRFTWEATEITSNPRVEYLATPDLDARKTPNWAGATPLCCHGTRGGRSSPVRQVRIDGTPAAIQSARVRQVAPNTRQGLSDNGNDVGTIICIFLRHKSLSKR